MGLFNDHVGSQRTCWTYPYYGHQLLDSAKKLLEEFTVKEQEAREKVASLLLDKTVAHSDPRISEAKRAIESNGTLREQLSVFVHEFIRNPDSIYQLGLGDVTFFGLNQNK